MRIFLKLLLTLGCLTLMATAAKADEGSLLRTETRTTKRNIRLYVSPEFTFVGGADRSAAGYGVGGGLIYGLSRRWGLAAGYRQTFYISGSLSPMFSQIELSAVYSISGGLISETSKTTLEGQAVIQSRSAPTNGLQLHMCLSQFLFNADSSIVQMTGIGAGLFYEFGSGENLRYQVGGRADLVLNRIYVLFPFQAVFGVSYQL